MSILIFSRKINSGKTSELQHWIDNSLDIGGILMPDVNNVRCMFNIRTSILFEAQCKDENESEELIFNVGKFKFYKSAFQKANNYLKEEIKNLPDTLIIDEIGKLELQGLGFNTSVLDAVKKYQSKSVRKVLILVVREELLKEVMQRYQIKKCKIVDSLG